MPRKPHYQTDDIILIPKKIYDVKLLADIFNETEEYIYNVEWVWMTEKQLLSMKKKVCPKN